MRLDLTGNVQVAFIPRLRDVLRTVVLELEHDHPDQAPTVVSSDGDPGKPVVQEISLTASELVDP